MVRVAAELITGAASLVPPAAGAPPAGHLGGGGGFEGRERFPPTGQEANSPTTVVPEGRGGGTGEVGPYGGFMPGA